MAPSKKHPPKILTIVVNWNKKDMLRHVLECLRTLGGTPFDVVVVDNASTDGSPDMVREDFPEVHLLETGKNLGGTGGFNAGMIYGLQHPKKYDFFWFLDNDVNVFPNALDGLLDTMCKSPRIGLVGSTILLMEDETRVQEIGARIDWQTGCPKKNAEGPLRSIKGKHLYKSDYVTACSMLARVSAVRKVGVWDPVYFVMWDDIDFGLRFNRAGYHVVGTTESRVSHEGFDDRRATSGPLSTYICVRNWLYFLHQLCPSRYRLTAFFNVLRIQLTGIENNRFDGQHADADAMQCALNDFFANRMGEPPAEVKRPRPPYIRESQKLPPSLNRIGILTYSHHHLVQELHQKLKEQYPKARIESILFEDKPKRIRTKLPNIVIFPIRTMFQRIRSSISMALRYDALVSSSLAPTHLYERFTGYSIRYREDDQQWQVNRRNLAKTLRLIVRRNLIVLRALILTFRALRKPRPPVDYHFYRR